MSWTGKSLQAYIEAKGVSWEDSNGNRDTIEWETFQSECAEGDWELDNGDKIEAVDQFRDDEHWVNIFKIGDQHFRILGNYDSWNGTDYYGAEIEEVRPKVINKTIYVRV